MDGVVCQENMLCPIILLHIYSLKILKLSDLKFLQGGGTCHFVILQGGGTCGRCGISRKYVVSYHLSSHI